MSKFFAIVFFIGFIDPSQPFLSIGESSRNVESIRISKKTVLLVQLLLNFSIKYMYYKFFLKLSVEMLKDRMIQLRNRYNLEKRKVDEMAEEGNPNPKSTWPLFEYLRFLDGHIRQRKSYKKMMRRSADQNNVNSNDNDSFDEAEYTAFTPKITLRDDSCTMKSEYGGSVENMHQQNHHLQQQQLHTQEMYENVYHENSGGGTSASHNNDSQELPSLPPLKRQKYNDYESSSSPMPLPVAAPKPDKFEAFGKFVTASLCDLPKQKALELIQKITSEIVQTLHDQ
jgi:hypothetical protein